jgi:hypothetical protein
MTPEELRGALGAARSSGAIAETSLAGEVRAASLELPAVAVGLTGAGDPALRLAARTLTGRLEEIAARLLIDAQPSGTLHEVWLLESAVGAAVALRARVGARLRPLLSDRRSVPVTPQPPENEEQPRPSRICDEAYLLLRQLTDSQESRTQLAFDSRAFRRLGESERDAEIAHAAAGSAFTRLIEDLEA